MKSKKRKGEVKVMGQVTLSMIIDFYVGDMERRGCTPDSVITNKRALIRFNRFLSSNTESATLADMTPAISKDYITTLQNREVKNVDHPNKPVVSGKLSPFTIRKEVKILRGFGTWLVKQGYRNPFEVLEIPKVPKHFLEVLTDEEIEQLLIQINPNTKFGSRQFGIVVLMLDSGLRVSEVVHARISDLDLEKRQLKVMGKGQKERIVPFGQRSAQAILRYLHLFRPEPLRHEDDHLFLSHDGIPMTRGSLQSMILRLRNSSGISKVRGHMFRHTFAVKFLTNGGDLRTLQLILGHESLVVTQRYLHLTNQQLQSQYQNFSPLDMLSLNSFRPFGDKRSRKK